jgi:hypothetical protein
MLSSSSSVSESLLINALVCSLPILFQQAITHTSISPARFVFPLQLNYFSSSWLNVGGDCSLSALTFFIIHHSSFFPRGTIRFLIHCHEPPCSGRMFKVKSVNYYKNSIFRCSVLANRVSLLIFSDFSVDFFHHYLSMFLYSVSKMIMQ